MTRNAIVVGIVLVTGFLAPPRVVAQPGATTTSSVHRFVDGSMVGSAFSTLVRSTDAIRMHVSTVDLDPGAAYTVWWVIFNNPENCSAPCNMDDIINPALRAAVQTAVGYAAGHVVSQDGKASFSARLRAGDLSGFGDGLDSTPPPPLGPGLLNPMGAEVHLVIRSHGSQIPGFVDQQIHTFGGGCTINTCVDKQFSIHMPPS
jgi:hypothetical protein